MGFVSDDGPGVDFDDLYTVWQQLASAEEEFLREERALNEYRATVQRDALHNLPKRPTVYELDKVISYLGNTEEEHSMLSKLSAVVENLGAKKTALRGTIDMMHKRIAIWQTKSANSRRTLLE